MIENNIIPKRCTDCGKNNNKTAHEEQRSDKRDLATPIMVTKKISHEGEKMFQQRVKLWFIHEKQAPNHSNKIETRYNVGTPTATSAFKGPYVYFLFMRRVGTRGLRVIFGWITGYFWENFIYLLELKQRRLILVLGNGFVVFQKRKQSYSK